MDQLIFIDNDGLVSLSDIGTALRAYLGLTNIDTFDLVNGSGERVMEFGPSAFVANSDFTLYLVENGDVSLDGGFEEIT